MQTIAKLYLTKEISQKAFKKWRNSFKK